MAKKPKILVVEDDEITAKLIATVLYDYDCQHVSRIRDAKAELPDDYKLVILDLSLPDSRGISSYERIRDVTDLPILVFTGATEANLSQRVATDKRGLSSLIIKASSIDIANQLRHGTEMLLAEQRRRENDRDNLTRLREALECLAR